MKGPLYTFAGETGSLAHHARRFGIDPDVLYRRVNLLGWPLEKAIHVVHHGNSKYITALGETRTRREWAEASNLTVHCIKSRMRRGWDPEEAVTLPKGTKVMRSPHEQLYTWQGEEYNITELAELAPFEITPTQMGRRLVALEWSIERAMTTPVRRRRKRAG